MNVVLFLQIQRKRQHTNLLTKKAKAKMGWTLLPHPPYSPNPPTSTFGSLKNTPRGRRFVYDDELKRSVREEQKR
jgi:hypothetical protein